MKLKSYPVILALAAFAFTLSSCHKDGDTGSGSSTVSGQVKLGLYEMDSSIYRLLFMAVPKVGTQTINAYLIYDTGSGGMVLDAHELIPTSMITSSGITFTGDSTVVNGITIYNQTDSIVYGADASTTETVYGYLAYADVTLGDHSGTVTIQRLPFFLYYKGVDNNGNALDEGSFDIIGVNSEYDVTFTNGAYVTSPFSYYEPGNTALTKGFKMAALGTTNWSYAGTYVADVITLGLTSDDLTSNGFTMHPLTYYSSYGYPPIVSGNYTYGSKTVSSAYLLYDTGTEPYSFLMDNTASRSAQLLAANTSVSTNTSYSFNYSFTVSSTENLTYVENSSSAGSSVSIISLSYFLNNSYLLDFTNHKMGLKKG